MSLGRQCQAPVSSIFRSTFIDARQGFAVNDRYRVWRTTDTSASWQRAARLGFVIDQMNFSDALHGLGERPGT